MAVKNNPFQSESFVKPLIIAVIVIVIAWIIGKGALTLISFLKQM